MKKQVFQALPLRKKILYLIDEIFPQVFLGTMLLLAIGTWFYEEYVKPPVYMNVEMINVCQESPNGESFDPFLEEAGYQCDDKKVEVSKILQLGTGENEIQGDLSKLLVCRIAQGKTDLFFWGSDELDEDMCTMALMDLRQILPRDVLIRYQDQLVYTAPVLDGGYPCGIRLQDNAWIQENNYYEECIVGVSRTAQDLEMIRAFFAYIL